MRTEVHTKEILMTTTQQNRSANRTLKFWKTLHGSAEVRPRTLYGRKLRDSYVTRDKIMSLYSNKNNISDDINKNDSSTLSSEIKRCVTVNVIIVFSHALFLFLINNTTLSTMTRNPYSFRYSIPDSSTTYPSLLAFETLHDFTKYLKLFAWF